MRKTLQRNQRVCFKLSVWFCRDLGNKTLFDCSVFDSIERLEVHSFRISRKNRAATLGVDQHRTLLPPFWFSRLSIHCCLPSRPSLRPSKRAFLSWTLHPPWTPSRLIVDMKSSFVSFLIRTSCSCLICCARSSWNALLVQRKWMPFVITCCSIFLSTRTWLRTTWVRLTLCFDLVDILSITPNEKDDISQYNNTVYANIWSIIQKQIGIILEARSNLHKDINLNELNDVCHVSSCLYP